MKRLFLLFALSACAYAQVFPTAVATNQNLGVAKDRSASTLNGAINNSTLSVVVASGAAFVANEYITIDSEQMQICSISTNTLTICTGTRGFGGTSAASHADLTAVRGQITASHHNNLANEIKAIETALGADLVNVYTSGVGSGNSGYIEFSGATSGGSGWGVANVAGTRILYLMPVTAGTAGDSLVDNGSTTCPTLPTGAPTLCHQMQWSTVSGGGGSGATSQGAFASLPGTCTTGDVYFFTDSLIGKARCSATNTWSYFVDGLGLVTPPVLANFTKPNGGTSSATNGGMTLLAASSGSLNARVLYETATYTAPASREACFVNSPLVGTNQQIGVGFMDLSAVKFEFIGNAYSAGTVLTHTYWSGYSVSGGAEIVAPNSIWSLQLASSPFKCFKAEDDGTNFKFYVSTDGRRSWSQFGASTGRTANMTTPNHFVFIVQNSNSMDTYGTVIHWQ